MLYYLKPFWNVRYDQVDKYLMIHTGDIGLRQLSGWFSTLQVVIVCVGYRIGTLPNLKIVNSIFALFLYRRKSISLYQIDKVLPFVASQPVSQSVTSYVKISKNSVR